MKKIFVKSLNELPDNFTGISEYPDGTKQWYKNGKLHREEGPCTTCKDCLKGNFVLCTKPGPAIELPNGTKKWLVNGEYHREDGPAIEFFNGKKAWWLYGCPTTKKQNEHLANVINLGYSKETIEWLIKERS